MSPFLFYLFAALTLIFGIAVVANRNPIASALSLVVSFLGLAALFVGLDAYFIAVIQVLVYAGCSTSRPRNGARLTSSRSPAAE
jgi:NADH-quinone oxidoreductase subunit J